MAWSDAARAAAREARRRKVKQLVFKGMQKIPSDVRPDFAEGLVRQRLAGSIKLKRAMTRLPRVKGQKKYDLESEIMRLARSIGRRSPI